MSKNAGKNEGEQNQKWTYFKVGQVQLIWLYMTARMKENSGLAGLKPIVLMLIVKQ